MHDLMEPEADVILHVKAKTKTKLTEVKVLKTN